MLPIQVGSGIASHMAYTRQVGSDKYRCHTYDYIHMAFFIVRFFIAFLVVLDPEEACWKFCKGNSDLKSKLNTILHGRA